MKRLLIYVIVVLTVISGSCKKDSNDDGTPATKMGCKIDGTAWSSTIRYSYHYDSKFSITATTLDGKGIELVIFGDTPGTYKLGLGQIQFSGAYGTIATNDVYAAISGTVVLTKVDITNKTISGTFEFSATKNLTETKTITNGTFNDLSYQDGQN